MPNFFDRLKVRTPSYNIFPQVTQNKLSMQIGRNIPVKYVEMHPGEEIDINMSQVTRFMPMLAPVFHDVNLEVIPFFCPFRLLKDFNFDAEAYFNPATLDSNRPAMPMITVANLYSGIDEILGSIWDYLRYPTFSWLLWEVQTNHADVTLSQKNDDSIILKYDELYHLWSTGDTVYTGVKISFGSIFSHVCWTFPGYVLYRCGLLSTPSSTTSWTTTSGDMNDSSFWQQVYEKTGLKYDELVDAYVNYLHVTLAKAFLSNGSGVGQEVSLLPWLCYTRIILDWFVNTNITTNYEQYYQDIGAVVSDIIGGYSMNAALARNFSYGADNEWYLPFSLSSGSTYIGHPAFCLWQSDYFTSAFPSAQSDAAVPIPAGGNIDDLTYAKQLQRFRRLNIFGGKRLIDQIFVHRGVHSSDKRLDRVECIGDKKVWRLSISDVLQTSQSTIDSNQGDFAGHGISVGGDHICHYRCEEPGLVMLIARVRPRSQYLDAVPRIIYKSDFYDFENPEFDNVGMQPVMYNELYCGFGNTSTVFGWHRRYTEYMMDFDECHADMKSSLDYWNMARRLPGHPTLNTEFITMHNSIDDWQRIFAAPGVKRSVISEMTFNIAVSRPLSKYVQFDY